MYNYPGIERKNPSGGIYFNFPPLLKQLGRWLADSVSGPGMKGIVEEDCSLQASQKAENKGDNLDYTKTASCLGQKTEKHSTFLELFKWLFI